MSQQRRWRRPEDACGHKRCLAWQSRPHSADPSLAAGIGHAFLYLDKGDVQAGDLHGPYHRRDSDADLRAETFAKAKVGGHLLVPNWDQQAGYVEGFALDFSYSCDPYLPRQQIRK